MYACDESYTEPVDNMKHKLYFDVVHDAYNGKPHSAQCTTIVTTRWLLPIDDYDNLVDMVNRINVFQEDTDGLRLYYPDEGYSCTVEALSEEILCALIGELEKEPGITDGSTGLRDIQNALYEILSFIKLKTVPATGYINITLTND